VAAEAGMGVEADMALSSRDLMGEAVVEPVDQAGLVR